MAEKPLNKKNYKHWDNTTPWLVDLDSDETDTNIYSLVLWAMSHPSERFHENPFWVFQWTDRQTDLKA